MHPQVKLHALLLHLGRCFKLFIILLLQCIHLALCFLHSLSIDFNFIRLQLGKMLLKLFDILLCSVNHSLLVAVVSLRPLGIVFIVLVQDHDLVLAGSRIFVKLKTVFMYELVHVFKD